MSDVLTWVFGTGLVIFVARAAAAVLVLVKDLASSFFENRRGKRARPGVVAFLSSMILGESLRLDHLELDAPTLLIAIAALPFKLTTACLH
jgi:hypothetical protein